ncbi:hypothetical protein VOLCADRAFT_105095 [Volvox carteri f. nagariensis]|uniref:Uncharacterized protein n=1 Tax=Volvox carteri f. nagariensis TaxID=3068 RepID=D8TYD6_VOLCA|nr:uncharacterized protein VOLCADRAFT_105095 [Volvox carteri f. nagariensis]EFJ47622.1 hypothetical protein VOLCADRAFT_105095 [Volvox carteri f. nagariensis]|eukprot:XP_002951446.1 hypothetical protein VOLCADRAFT_105095 [Volvox carteri f. nagariensis]
MADPEAEVHALPDFGSGISYPSKRDKLVSTAAVTFTRSVPDVHARVAELLNLPETERVRCFHLPMFEKVLGWSVHMYLDLDAVQNGMQHNTNATQLWLIANLPNEPPEVQPDSIHGPVLLTAENFKDEEYVQLSQEEWQKIVDKCKEVQPNAQFLPAEHVATPPGMSEPEQEQKAE